MLDEPTLTRAIAYLTAIVLTGGIIRGMYRLARAVFEHVEAVRDVTTAVGELRLELTEHRKRTDDRLGQLERRRA